MRRLPWIAVTLLAVCAAASARAADVPITGLKLIVVDKLAASSKAKAVFVAKDQAITKGAATDPAQIEATLNIAYEEASGSFVMAQGSRWLVNSAKVGKYVNKSAPTGGSVKVSVVKPASLVKVVAKSLGDAPLNIASAPTGNVYVVDAIVNGGEETRLCTQFAGCVHKSIAGATGYKLVCKGNSTGDPDCTAAVPATTTSTSIPATTTTTVIATTTTTLPICPAGSFSATGFEPCTACPVGSFAATPGSNTCAACPADTFANVTGSSECTPCAPGTTSLPGSAECTPI